MPPVLHILLVAAAVLTCASACGEDAPFCGDKKLNAGEECDDGNYDDTDFCLSTCKARQLSSLTVKWEFNRDAAPDFTGDSCIDLGASKVEITLTGGVEPLVSLENCSFRQAVFTDIPAADYGISVRVFDSQEAELTSAPLISSFDFPGGIATTEVVIPPELWVRAYLGTFFFRVAWAGTDCALAVPPVTEQRLTLVVAGGETFTGTTTTGASLDGSAASACVSLDEQFPQSALEVPFGAATLTIEGLDDEGTAVFAEVYETFIGAGVNNPELIFDVDLIAL